MAEEPATLTVSKEAFRKALGLFATGVTVVTVRRPSGPWGFTVNSFTSVSLTPPLVLFCVAEGSDSYAAVRESDHFVVNLLTEEQEEISRRFASRIPDRFEGVRYRDGMHGVPLLEGCLGYIQCQKAASHPAGDHLLVIGEVLDAEVIGGNPLLFYRSAYARIVAPADKSRLSG